MKPAIQLCHNRSGVTLIEQLVALLLGTVMMAALYEFYRAELFRTISQEAKTATLEDARGAMDIMVRDLRNAGSWATGSAPAESGGADDPATDADTNCNRVYAASAAMVHVQMDLNGNGSCGDLEPRENIRYELTGPTSTCPGTSIIRRNGDCLVANIKTATAGKLFTYYDASGADLGESPSLPAIKRIRIAFSVRVKNPDPQVGGDMTSTLSTSFELRN
ncbi:MAG TPA: prepilin-type N-terminal cleavage/methylation domain-containing protein [Candidatus Binatia bacterium]|nr:prepilin-type N-terminal cleavage/methylation domain-containing protein [Candidatus Binatia bacterium]